MQKALYRIPFRFDPRRIIKARGTISFHRQVNTMTDQLWTRVPARDALPSYMVYSKEMQKPDLDDRNYRLIKLENGLEALLIHDPNTDKAAAAMNVGVGSLSDPVSYFLGTGSISHLS